MQYQFEFNDEESTRLDKFVHLKLPEFTRSYIKNLIDQQFIVVNHEPKKAGYILRPKDMINVSIATPSSAEPHNITIIYEDDHCIVINKPAGILSHSKGAANTEYSVASFIQPMLTDDFGDSNRAGIVHRLDRATSGVMLCAKNLEAQKFFQKQFSTRRVEKTYTAVVEGQMKQKHAAIDIALTRNPNNPKLFKVSSNDSGKQAYTEYTVLKENTNYSLLELKPKTGRTHQLRVHLSYTGHPIVGDELYGGKTATRLYLHACKLSIKTPDNILHTFEAEVPANFYSDFNDE